MQFSESNPVSRSRYPIKFGMFLKPFPHWMRTNKIRTIGIDVQPVSRRLRFIAMGRAWPCVIALFFFGAWSSRLTAQLLQPVLPPAIASQYTLFWNDEFDGTQLDTGKWDYRALGPRGPGIDSAAMVALDGAGHLKLSVQQSGSSIYSAMIGTQGKFQTVYGYFECRAMLQTVGGPTSAFWLQSPTTGNPIGNPALAGDEVDIFECYTPQTEKFLRPSTGTVMGPITRFSPK